jgi:hypothetical protein
MASKKAFLNKDDATDIFTYSPKQLQFGSLPLVSNTTKRYTEKKLVNRNAALTTIRLKSIFISNEIPKKNSTPIRNREIYPADDQLAR